MTAPPPEPPLPYGWEKMTDRATVYYKNSALGVEQADRPGLPEKSVVGATVSCGISLPLDTVDARCSANAPPPPLKAYILSILTPILEESADALFQTLRVKPYELAQTAVSDAVMTQALTPEVLERMKALDDPQVQQVLANFKANVQTAVQESFAILNNGLGDNVGELLGTIATKLSSAIQLLIADLPGVGVFMSGAQVVDAGITALEKGQVIVDEVQSALAPINALGAQVSAVTSAVSAAPPSAAPQNAVPPSAVPQNAVPPSAASHAVPPSAASHAATASEVPPIAVPPSGATAKKNIGGSRKRRRIHKLSRRIERTLRRVQKKYGLKGKSDFLRRTLRRGTRTPQGSQYPP